MKFKRVKCLILTMILVISSSVCVLANVSNNWNINHRYVDSVFYGRVEFSNLKLPFKSVITYYGHIGGSDGSLMLLSTDSAGNAYRNPSDEVRSFSLTEPSHN